MGFGCAGLSGLDNTPLSHEAGCSVIKEFDRSITFFDTSNLYGHNHDNENMARLAQAFRRLKAKSSYEIFMLSLK